MRMLLNVRNGLRSRTACTGTSPPESGKQQVNALTVHPAALRERERLDTREAYQNQGCFRSSLARSHDHARIELRNPGGSAG